MTMLTGARITSDDGSPGTVVNPDEPTAVMSLYPLRLRTILWGLLIGNIVAGIVCAVLYAIAR